MTTTTPFDREFVVELQQLVRRAMQAEMPAMVNAIRGLISAMEYEDQALIASFANTFVDAIQDLVTEISGYQRTIVERIKSSCDNARKHVRENPGGNHDAIGASLQEAIDQMLKSCLRVREAAARLDGRIDDSTIQENIQTIQALRTGVVQNWPWSKLPPPPVDRGMVERSRAAFRRGEVGESVSELIHRLGGPCENGAS